MDRGHRARIDEVTEDLTMSSTNIFDALNEIAGTVCEPDRVIPTLIARGFTMQDIVDEFGGEDAALAAWHAERIESGREAEEAATYARRQMDDEAIRLIAEALCAGARAAGYEVSQDQAAESRSVYVVVRGEDDYVKVRLSDHAAKRGCGAHFDVSVTRLHETATHLVDPVEDDIEHFARGLLASVLAMAGKPETFA